MRHDAARAVRARLGRLLRANQPSRGRAAPGPRRRLRPPGLPDARPLPPRGGEAVARLALRRGRGGAAGRRHGGPAGAQRAARQPRRLLPHRPRPAGAGAPARLSAEAARRRAELRPRPSAAGLLRRPRRRRRRRAGRAGLLRRRGCGVVWRPRHNRRRRRRPGRRGRASRSAAGRRHCGLACQPLALLVSAAARPAQAASQGRRPGRLRRVRRHADPADAAAERGRPSGAFGGPLFIQSRPAAAFRPADRLHRRPDRTRAGGRRHRSRRPGRRPRPQRALRRRRAGSVLRLPPPPPVERGAGLLDGLGTQAREIVGIQPPPSRRPRRQLHDAQRRSRPAAAHPLRHHARRRHAAAARRRPPADCDPRASAESAPPRLGRGARRRRLRRAAAAHQPDADGRPQVALRPHFRRLGRPRPLHDGRLRRLPGPVRRRLLHRQGRLRRGRFRGRRRPRLPRQPHPEPRPHRGQLRPLRPGDGHRIARRVPGVVPRLRPARAPLGARRLADPAVAVPARPGPPRPSERV